MAIIFRHSNRFPRLTTLSSVLAAAVVAVAMAIPGTARSDSPQSGRPISSFAPILEKVIPAVVTIRVTGETLKPVEFLSRKDGQETAAAEKETFRAGGSGVIVDAGNGYILTNNHVIENATRIEVGLSDGRRMLAKLIGRDIGTDVAVIKVEEPNLPSVAVGNSDQVRVGDVIMAVGNPFGLESTATLGIISALMRTEVGHEAFEDFMQIDAQINPGNSGGALVNINGELVGINTAVAGGPDRNVGIGFAIPINMAEAVKSELIAHGRMRRGSLGLVVEDLVPEAAPASMIGPKRGAVITRVRPVRRPQSRVEAGRYRRRRRRQAGARGRRVHHARRDTPDRYARSFRQFLSMGGRRSVRCGRRRWPQCRSSTLFHERPAAFREQHWEIFCPAIRFTAMSAAHKC